MAMLFWDVYEEGYEGPEQSPMPWERGTLNGFKVPGIFDVRCTPRIKLEIPKASGRDGGPAIEKGHLPAEVDITITIWTPQHLRLFEALMIGIWRAPGQDSTYQLTEAGQVVKATRAVSIAHPKCNGQPYNITAILLERVSSLEPGREAGTRACQIKAMQYLPPSKTVATRKAAGAGRVPVAKEIAGARSAPPTPPSRTDAVAKLPPTPNRGPS